jgi:hypothetical protein
MADFPEKRTRRRIAAPLPGRFMLSNRIEYHCTLTDVSEWGVGMTAPIKGAIGETVVAYIERLGRVQGKIVRIFDDGFALILTASGTVHQRFLERLNALEEEEGGGEKSEPDPAKRQRDDATAPQSRSTAAREFEVLELSVHGAELKVANRPPIGDCIEVGQLSGKVVEHTASGIRIEFVDAHGCP